MKNQYRLYIQFLKEAPQVKAVAKECEEANLISPISRFPLVNE